MSNTERNRLGKGLSQNKDNAWFVGYAPRRNPEIVVSVLVEGGEHGAGASGPIVRDIVKAYYDKKEKKNQGQVTTALRKDELGNSENIGTPGSGKTAVKQEESAAVLPTSEKKKARP